MSSARIDPSLRLGAYRLDDIYRALGFSEWMLCNLRDRNIPLPLMADMFLALHAVGLVELQYDAGRYGLYYNRGRGAFIWLESFVLPLARDEADRMLAGVIARAEAMNADPAGEFRFTRIVAFGSYLSPKPILGDLDIGAEAYCARDGSRVPEPAYYPLRSRCAFDRWASVLSKGAKGRISVHDIREVLTIKAAYRQAWTAQEGITPAAPVIPGGQSAEQLRDMTEDKTRDANQQRVLDAVAERIATQKSWPRAVVPDLTSVRALSRARFAKLSKEDDCLMALAHYRLLPSGALRDQVAAAIGPLDRFSALEPLVLPFIKASIEYVRWSLRPNGRVLRSGAAT